MTIPGYLPMVNNAIMMDLFRASAARLVGSSSVVTHSPKRNRGGSTDMGDVSHILPVIHPYTGGAIGHGHGIDYLIKDYDQAVVNPAKAMAMMVIDLLAENAQMAREVLAKSPPGMTRGQYLAFQDRRLSEELYEGK